MAIDLASIIDEQASGIVKAMKMPSIKTTSIEKENKKKERKKIFKTKVFVIIDDVSGEEYSTFINYLMEHKSETLVIREVENWTKDGELIRVIDYVEEEDATDDD